MEIRTDWNGSFNGGNDASYQPYNGGSYTFNVGSASLLIDASSITTGSITAGNNFCCNAYGNGAAVMLSAQGANGVTINGGVTVNSGQSILISAGAINYTGTLSTGAGTGNINLWTTSHSIDVGLGGTAQTNTGTFALTNAELQNINTGSLFIEGGTVNVFSNLNVSGDGLNYMEVRTDFNGIGYGNDAPYSPYNGGSYTFNVGSNTALLIDASVITTGSITAGTNFCCNAYGNGAALYAFGTRRKRRHD